MQWNAEKADLTDKSGSRQKPFWLKSCQKYDFKFFKIRLNPFNP